MIEAMLLTGGLKGMQIKSIQVVESSASEVISINEVDPSKTFLFIDHEIAFDSQEPMRVHLADSTTVRFFRFSSITKAAKYVVYIVEFKDGVKVMRGVETDESGGSSDIVSLPALVNDASRCITSVTSAVTGSAFTTYGASRLISNSELEVTSRSSSSDDRYYAWQVLEFL